MSFLIKYDDELIERIASRVAREACSLAYGMLSDAPVTIYTNDQAWELRLVAPGETRLESGQKLNGLILQGEGGEVWYGHEGVVSVDADRGASDVGVSLGEKITIAVVIISLLARRPVAAKGGPRPILRMPRLTERQIRLLAKASEKFLKATRRSIRLIGAWAAGWLQDEILERAFAVAAKIRGNSQPSAAAWLHVYHGMRHLMIPVILDELAKNALPQSPSYPRSAPRLAVTRTGRKTPGPAVELRLPDEK